MCVIGRFPNKEQSMGPQINAGQSSTMVDQRISTINSITVLTKPSTEGFRAKPVSPSAQDKSIRDLQINAHS